MKKLLPILLIISACVSNQTTAEAGNSTEMTDTTEAAPAANNSLSNEPLSIAELLSGPVYDTTVTIYGEVSLHGQINSTSFRVTSGNEFVHVWYDMMAEYGETPWPSVNVDDIENGTRVIVTGQLQDGNLDEPPFWAESIELMTD